MPADADALEHAITVIRRIADQRGVESVICDMPRSPRLDVSEYPNALSPLDYVDTVTIRFKLPD